MLSLRLVAILSVLFSLGGSRPGKHYLIETEDRPKAHLKQRHGGSKAKQVKSKSQDYSDIQEDAMLCEDGANCQRTPGDGPPELKCTGPDCEHTYVPPDPAIPGSEGKIECKGADAVCAGQGGRSDPFKCDDAFCKDLGGSTPTPIGGSPPVDTYGGSPPVDTYGGSPPVDTYGGGSTTIGTIGGDIYGGGYGGGYGD